MMGHSRTASGSQGTAALEDRIVSLLLAGHEATEAEIVTALAAATADVRQALASLLVRGLIEIRGEAQAIGTIPTPRSRFGLARPDTPEGLNIGRLRALMDQSSFGDRRPRRKRRDIDPATVAGVVAAANNANNDPFFERLAYALALLSDGAADAQEDALLTLMGLLSDPAAAGLHSQIHDVLLAMLRDGKAHLNHQATHDPLTALPNRRLFDKRLAAAFDRSDTSGRRLGICFIDLDNYKTVNETLGHQFGDELLRSIATNLMEKMSEHLVARLDSDKFVILVEDTAGSDDMLQVAASALAGVSEPSLTRGYSLRVTASIGVVEGPAASTTPSEIFRAAETALRWAKAEGRARYALFDPKRVERELARYRLSAALPAALLHGELFLDYQPLVSLGDDAVVGAEALVRWRHPQLGVLSPDAFIGMAEENGLIVKLGAWVLEEACKQAQQWSKLGPLPPFVSVNIAIRQIRAADFVPHVTALLKRYELQPPQLHLEVTESALMHDDDSMDVLHSLADLGVRIAVDDFGTGYSNLAYLRTLPVCELKVAGTLVAGLHTHSPEPTRGADGQILNVLVSLAHALGLTVTAKGVETAEQADRLRALGCDTAQGWYFGAPTEPQNIDTLFTSTEDEADAETATGLEAGHD